MGGIWYIWDTDSKAYVSTGITAEGSDGAEWYSGTEVSVLGGDATIISGARAGDFYLNTQSSWIFRLMSTGIWLNQMQIQTIVGAAVQAEEPEDAPVGSLWFDTDDSGGGSAGGLPYIIADNGVKVYFGTAVSAEGTAASAVAGAVVNDLYLNITSWTVYKLMSTKLWIGYKTLAN